ncbi:hypothetical protein GA417_05600 [Poseidonibacter ostreae]|uniref:hypothetical protein n=1 Tax=Poseidonibacter ostreae TaxID=2654171 RepID=UPI001264578E|nr:hypothetical protein [Poseidonibacter ostreae]KAB7886424.1 hypothetical protein GA417_05600 [Poseidonibacter ostreae]
MTKESAYIIEIAQFYEVNPFVIKKQLNIFELTNIRMYELNKRYAFYEELVALLKKHVLPIQMNIE